MILSERRKGQYRNNAFIVAVLFTLVTPLMFIGFSYALPVFQELDLDTAPTVNDTVSENFDNWSQGTLMNLETDGDILYATSSSSGTWTSPLFDFPRNRVLSYEYSADMRDGNGTLTINAWRDNLGGSPDRTEVVELESGVNSGEVNFSESDYFEAVIDLEETSGSNNQRPNVDYLTLDFEILNSDEVGLSQSQALPLLVLSYLAGILLFMFSAYFMVKFVLETQN